MVMIDHFPFSFAPLESFFEPFDLISIWTHGLVGVDDEEVRVSPNIVVIKLWFGKSEVIVVQLGVLFMIPERWEDRCSLKEIFCACKKLMNPLSLVGTGPHEITTMDDKVGTSAPRQDR